MNKALRYGFVYARRQVLSDPDSFRVGLLILALLLLTGAKLYFGRGQEIAST